MNFAINVSKISSRLHIHGIPTLYEQPCSGHVEQHGSGHLEQHGC